MTPPPDIDPRIAHTRSVVVNATAALLAEDGFERLTVEAIAERSGVARSTIYRNWPDRTELLAAGFDELCPMPHVPDLGCMETELRALANELVENLGTADWAQALPSLVGAAHHDPGLTAAQRSFSAQRGAMVATIFTRAIERGDIESTKDPMRLAESFASGFFYRFLMSRLPLDDAFAESQIAAVLVLARN